MSETLTWWIMMQVVGLAALPLCLLLFRRLRARALVAHRGDGGRLLPYVHYGGLPAFVRRGPGRDREADGLHVPERGNARRPLPAARPVARGEEHQLLLLRLPR